MQPPPVLTEAQVKVAGPVQPAGRVVNPVEMDRLVAVSPSSVVNVTLNAVLDPTATPRVPVVEGVATTLSFVRVGGGGVVTTGGGGVGDDSSPPHAAKIARLATRAQRLRIFEVLIIGSSAAFAKLPI
jgi:hypothetical protein